LFDCILYEGQVEGLFKKKGNREGFKPSLCFSLVSPQRSLDVVCKDEQDYARWIRILTPLVMRMQTNEGNSVAGGTPAPTPKAASSIAPPTTPKASGVQ